MKKHIASLLALFLLICAVLPFPASAEALDPAHPGSITLHYTQSGTGFANLEIAIYRVAQAHENGTFTPVDPFRSYPVSIYGVSSQAEWNTIASTYRSYIIADNITPTRSARTDASGTVVFSNLETGLYLVMGVTAENSSGIYTFNTFMIYVPTPAEDGTYDYDVEAVPKCIQATSKNSYKVVKLWKDTGYSSSRPKEVTVEIYKNGTLQESVKLNASNNWTYTWNVPENQDGTWTVTEKNTPQHYSVTITESNGVFTVTNSRSASPSSPPKTGDMFPLWPLVATMCLSGTLLILLAIYHKRKNK